MGSNCVLRIELVLRGRMGNRTLCLVQRTRYGAWLPKLKMFLDCSTLTNTKPLITTRFVKIFKKKPGEFKSDILLIQLTLSDCRLDKVPFEKRM